VELVPINDLQLGDVVHQPNEVYGFSTMMVTKKTDTELVMTRPYLIENGAASFMNNGTELRPYIGLEPVLYHLPSPHKMMRSSKGGWSKDWLKPENVEALKKTA
jgi:hypothetical protein